MIRIGIAGLGFMGMIHYLASAKAPGCRVTALSSRDKAKLGGDWRGIRGNFGPPGTMMDLGHLKRYENYADLLADPEIDLIDICTPTHLHEEMAIAALKAGKHVLVEKAIALGAARLAGRHEDPGSARLRSGMLADHVAADLSLSSAYAAAKGDEG